MRVGQPNWTWASMCSTACSSWEARTTSASPNLGRGWGPCPSAPYPCNTAPRAPRQCFETWANPNDSLAYAVLAAAYALSGRAEDGKAALAESLRLQPDTTIKRLFESW